MCDVIKRQPSNDEICLTFQGVRVGVNGVRDDEEEFKIVYHLCHLCRNQKVTFKNKAN